MASSKNQNKTKQHSGDVMEFLHSVEPARRRQDALALVDIFTQATGFTPRMWGPSIVGFGEYHYRYKTGREGDHLATGFSPRKAKMTIYIMPGYGNFSEILSRIGKHSLGKSCFYFNRLSDLDVDVLQELIRAGLKDLQGHYPVKPT